MESPLVREKAGKEGRGSLARLNGIARKARLVTVKESNERGDFIDIRLKKGAKLILVRRSGRAKYSGAGLPASGSVWDASATIHPTL